jgi:hypothetical protein
MTKEKKENGQGTEKVKPLSLFEERMRGLLDELDGHMAQVGEDYGPILLEVLQNRLELIIKNFDEEVYTLVTDSFKKWKLIDTQLREFVKSDIAVPNQMESKKKPEDASVPDFIKGVDFGPIRSK